MTELWLDATDDVKLTFSLLPQANYRNDILLLFTLLSRTLTLLLLSYVFYLP
ncbi:unnamed protein product [Chondrus crispus]|uniref:Uncharacterized protein n=1 Tax=Chondrus crispus TaxID=2769 RepID=R7Q3R9_CHOCR|nr:unnamed protein product [Chondrus crispus]CDF32674.1 unnamed protein product [Chondrus crispus]|eukprot:XP_005712445.1 unnamed protein product [Chondrus crispus]